MITFESLMKMSRVSDILEMLITDRGRKLPFFEMNQILEKEVPAYFEAMKTISLNDILEFAEKRELITIHRK
jgi:hypothetical protein